jgi:hypothetical protein
MGHKIYQIVIKYSKPTDNIPTFSVARPAKIYQTWYFWFANIPCGNPTSKGLQCHRECTLEKMHDWAVEYFRTKKPKTFALDYKKSQHYKIFNFTTKRNIAYDLSSGICREVCRKAVANTSAFESEWSGFESHKHFEDTWSNGSWICTYLHSLICMDGCVHMHMQHAFTSIVLHMRVHIGMYVHM